MVSCFSSLLSSPCLLKDDQPKYVYFLCGSAIQGNPPIIPCPFTLPSLVLPQKEDTWL